MRPKFPLLAIAIIAVLSGIGPMVARAELTWKQTAEELHADAKSTVLEAHFPFTNTGSGPVDVTQVESSCGCTVVSLEKRHYEPRETGEIVASYTVGVQTGVQKKTVLVETNDGRPPTTLTLEIHIPEIVRIQPTFVQWKHGEPTAPKTITLEIVQDTPVKEVSVRSSTAAIQAEVKAVTPGRKYELTIRPESTEQRQFSTVTIQCRFDGEPKTFYAYATVRPAETKD